MTQDMFKKPEVWSRANPASKAGHSSWQVWLITALAAGIVTMAGLMVALAGGGGQAVLPASGSILAQAVVGPNRVLLTDEFEGPTWLSFYRNSQDLLGEPLAGPQSIGACIEAVVFANYIICHSSEPAVKGSQWEYPPMVLGLESLPTGVERRVDTPLAPAAKAFVDASLTAKGRDWLYFLGRSISDPFCTEVQCGQVFERQILSWPNRPAVNPAEVHLAPLGQRTLSK